MAGLAEFILSQVKNPKGSWGGLPDFGITEAFASGNTNAQGGSDLISNTPQGQVQGVQNPYIEPNQYSSLDEFGAANSSTGTGSSGEQYFNTDSNPPLPPVPTPQPSGGGGGGGNTELQQLEAIGGDRNPAQESRYQELSNLFNQQRGSAQDQTQREIQAALGVYDQQRKNLMSRIPELEGARDLRLQGLDQGYQQYSDTANRESQAREGGFGEQRQGVEEQYTRASRQTRAAAKSLSRKLRNMFAGRGAIDSTQYRDYNIEQSRDIARSVGDIGREKAGKLSTIAREEENIKQFYSEKLLQEQQNVNLQKDKVRQETDGLIQQVLGNADLTDAQKVETIVQAQSALSQRLSELDQQEFKLKEDQRQSDQDMAIKLAELRQKGLSAGYKSTLSNQKALQGAIDTVAKYQKSTNASPEMVSAYAKQIFADRGLGDKYKDYSQFFGAPTQDDLSQDDLVSYIQQDINGSGSGSTGSSYKNVPFTNQDTINRLYGVR